MSIARSYDVKCDALGCEYYTTGPRVFAESETDAVRRARNDACVRGWLHRDGRDYCPVHAL